MKFLLILVVVLVVAWLLRSGRRRVDSPPPNAAPNPAPSQREAVIACAQCGLMLPTGEALPGKGGVFCCEAHRSAFEASAAP